MKISFPPIFLLLIILIFSTQDTFACSCMENPTIDIAYEKTPYVIILQIDDFERLTLNGKDLFLLSKATVKKVFKGDLKVGQQLDFESEFSTCDYAFPKDSLGSEWLVYLQKPNSSNAWFYDMCSRSGSVKYKIADIKYLENIKKVAKKPRLSGTLRKLIGVGDYEDPKDELLGNKTVRIVGNGKDIKLQTDENGVYEIYDLPYGKYNISVESLAGYKTTDPYDSPPTEIFPIEITKSNPHSEQNVNYYVDNSISGKLLDSNQKPLRKIFLRLVPFGEDKNARSYYKVGRSERDGTFSIERILPGKYILIVNEEGRITATEPFKTLYYPNTLNKEEAQIITIREGEHLKDMIITAPHTAEVITLSGVLLYQDGKPVESEWVNFHPLNPLDKGKYDWDGVNDLTDENGRFEIRILKENKEHNGKLVSSIDVYGIDYENCPQIYKMIKEKYSNQNSISIVLKTPEFEINTKEDLAGIELKFPIPSCEKNPD